MIAYVIYIVFAFAYVAIWASLYHYWEKDNEEPDAFSFVASFIWWIVIPIVLFIRFVKWSAGAGQPLMGVIYGDR